MPATAEPARIEVAAWRGGFQVSKVQYWLHPADAPLPADDPHLARGDWQDATILGPPERWGGDLPGDVLPDTPLQFGPSGAPRAWPLRYTVVHWSAVLNGRPRGLYALRCRSTSNLNGTLAYALAICPSGRAEIDVAIASSSSPARVI